MLLLFSEYHLELTPKTLPEATNFCNNLGQKLFEPKSLEADNEVSKLAKAQGLTWGPWIGIHDQIIEGNFMYVSSNTTILYENWNTGEPTNNWRGTDEDCVIMGLVPGKWYDAPCRKYPVVCENCGKYAVVCEKSGEFTAIES